MRITHIETGISAESRSERSQVINRKLAFKKLSERLIRYVLEKERQEKPISNETIRVYNLPDNRVKDYASGFRQSYSQVFQDIGPMVEARSNAV